MHKWKARVMRTSKVEICMLKWSHFDLIIKSFSCCFKRRHSCTGFFTTHQRSSLLEIFMFIQCSNTSRELQMTPHESFLGFSLQQFSWIQMRWRLSTRINCNFVSFIEHKENRFDLRFNSRFHSQSLGKILIKTREINWNSSKACLVCRELFCVHFLRHSSDSCRRFLFSSFQLLLQLFCSHGILRKLCEFSASIEGKKWMQKSFQPRFVPLQSSNCEWIKITLHEFRSFSWSWKKISGWEVINWRLWWDQENHRRDCLFGFVGDGNWWDYATVQRFYISQHDVVWLSFCLDIF